MGVSLDYSVSVTTNTIGELPAYIRDWHINTAELVSTGGAGNNYASQLAYIKSLNLKPVLDIEMDIWAGGQIQSPIGNFTGFLQSIKAAGWPTISSEGGRSGDPSFMKGVGLGYINYNCDQCGLWQNIYSDGGTAMNLWECYYPSEVGYITSGANSTKGKANGVLAGAWRDALEHKKCYPEHYADAPHKKFKGDNDILNNSINGVQPSYESIIDSLIALGCSVTRFDVWGGISSSRAQNQACGFDSIVANLQKNHPPNGIGPAPPPPVTKKMFASAPVSCSMVPGRVDEFVKGTDNALWHNYPVIGATNWESLGGVLTSAPACVARSGKIIDVVARGSDGACYLKEWNGTQWLDWKDLSGIVAANTPLGLIAVNDSSLNVYVIGTDGNVWVKSMSNAVWGAWKRDATVLG